MSELRQNFATKEWVIMAPGRAARPHDSGKQTKKTGASVPAYQPDCPFCPGNEASTEPPVWAVEKNGEWQVRVVPNKFAALSREGAPVRHSRGRFLAAEGFGIADVVIEHPRHDLSPALMEVGDVSLILRGYRERYRQIDGDERINLVTIFRNHGAGAGTSLAHPHSQIIATPIVPPHVRDAIEQAIRHYDINGSCVYCDLLTQELEQQSRVILWSEHFLAFCPYASRSPYECRIYPRRHMAGFIQTTDAELDDLAVVLKSVLLKLYRRLDNPDYNYLIRSAPSGDQDTRFLHWYMVIIPRISTRAGFEIGTDIYINPVPPEEAAEELRNVRVE